MLFFFFFFWKSTCLYLEQRADKLDWEVTKAQSLWSPRAGMMKWGTLCFQRQRRVFKKRCWRHFETNRAGCANKLLAFVRWETISPDKKPFQKEILLVLSNKQGRLRKTKRCLCNHKVNLCEVRNHLTRKETAFLKCANVFKKQRKKKTSHSFWKEIGSYHLTEKRDNMFLKWHLLMFSSYSWKANAYWSSERVLKSRYKFLCDSDPHC